jgi:hypothetical protein
MSNSRRINAKRRGETKRSDFLAHAQDVLTRNFQREIRNSELWPRMVAEFGDAKAEELLKQCKGELQPEGVLPDEAWDRPTDI